MQFGVLQSVLDLIPDEITYASVMNSRLVQPKSMDTPPPFSFNGYVVYEDCNYTVSDAFVEALEKLYLCIGPLYQNRKTSLLPSTAALAKFLLSCVDFKIMETRESISPEKYVYLHNKSFQFFEFLLEMKQCYYKMNHENQKSTLDPKIRLCPLHQIVHLYSFFKCIQDMLMQQLVNKSAPVVSSAVLSENFKSVMATFDKLHILVQNSECRVLQKVQTSSQYSNEMLELLLVKQYTEYTGEILKFCFQSVDYQPLDSVELNYVVLAFVRTAGLTSGRLYAPKDKTFSKMSDYENHLSNLMWSHLWNLFHGLKSQIFQCNKEYLIQESRPHIRLLVDAVKFYLTIVDWKNKTCVSSSFVVCFQNKGVLNQKQSWSDSCVQQSKPEGNFNPVIHLDQLFEDLQNLKD